MRPELVVSPQEPVHFLGDLKLLRCRDVRVSLVVPGKLHGCQQLLCFGDFVLREMLKVPYEQAEVALAATVDGRRPSKRKEQQLELGRVGINVGAPGGVVLEVVYCSTDRADNFDVNGGNGQRARQAAQGYGEDEEDSGKPWFHVDLRPLFPYATMDNVPGRRVPIFRITREHTRFDVPPPRF